MHQYGAWLTGRLVGFAKIPDYEKLFPSKASENAPVVTDVGALLSSFGFRVIKA